MIAFGQDREDVGALQTVSCQCWCPAPSRELGGNMVLADGLGLLGIHHEMKLSGTADLAAE